MRDSHFILLTPAAVWTPGYNVKQEQMQRDWLGSCQRGTGTNSWWLKTEEGGRQVAGLGIYLEVQPQDLLNDWILTGGGGWDLGNKTKCMSASTITITAFYNKQSWFSLHLCSFQNSATRAVPPSEHAPLAPDDNLNSVSHHTFVQPTFPVKNRKVEDGGSEASKPGCLPTACPLPLWRRAEAVLSSHQQMFSGKKEVFGHFLQTNICLYCLLWRTGFKTKHKDI